MNTQTFEEQFKNWIAEWKTRLEEMQVQFSLGKMDAAEAFEKQKDNLRNLVNMLKDNIEKSTEMAEETATKVLASLEELQLQLNLGKAEGKDAFEAQRKKIEAALHEVYINSKTAYGNNFNYMMKLFDNNAQAFKTGLEIVQLQFALLKMDVKDDSEKLRKEMQHKMHDFYNYAEKAQQITKENIEQWNNQLHEGYEKMRNWMNEFKPKG
jgi:hypothetical protein